AKMHQRVVPLAGFHNDIATASAVSARGTTAWNELFPTECHAAIAAIAGFYTNFGFVDEHELLAASCWLLAKSKALPRISRIKMEQNRLSVKSVLIREIRVKAFDFAFGFFS